MSSRLSTVRRHLPPLAGFAVLTVAFYWPLVRGFGSRLIAPGGDGATFIWAYWALPRAAARLDDPFVTDQLFHPVGADLSLHTATPLWAFAAWPVTTVFGVVAAVNTVELVAAFLSAVGAYLLALHVCADRRAAFVAGVAFAFVPYRFVHAGVHLNLVHAHVLPFGLLFLLRLAERPSAGRAVALGVVVGLTFLTDFNLTVFLVLAIAVVAVARRRHVLRPEVRPALAMSAAVAAVVALPLAVPVLRAVFAGELEPLAGLGGGTIFSADLFSWVVPPGWHPLWGSAVRDVRRSLSGLREGVAYPGLVVLAAAVAGRELGERERRRGWVALAVVGGVLAMGPFLHVAGRSGGLFTYEGAEFTVPLPYLAFHVVPVLEGVRVPGRFAIVAALGIAVLAAVTVAALMRRSPRRARVIFAAVLAVTLVDLLPGSLATRSADVPRPYDAIAADRGTGAVMEVPLQWKSGLRTVGSRAVVERDHSEFMYYATVHGRPLVNGYLARYPAERFDRLTSIPVYREMLALGGEPGYDDEPVFGVQDLRALGIGYVVYHRDAPQPRAFEYLDGLGMEVLADDGTVIAWKVDG